MKIRDIIIIILFLFIFASFLVVAEFLFKKIFIERLSDYTASALGAFMGAFFAFVLIRFGDFLNRIREKRTKEYNEFFSLNVLFNRYIQILSDNRGLLNVFIQTLSSGKAYVGGLNPFPLRDETTLNLTNIHFINKVFSFMISLDKVNDDIARMNQWNTELRIALLQKNIDHETYKLNVSNLVNKLKEIDKFLIHLLENEILPLTAEVRILLRKEKTLINKILGILFGANKIKVSKDEIDREKQKLQKEIQEVREKSKKDIEDALTNA